MLAELRDDIDASVDYATKQKAAYEANKDEIKRVAGFFLEEEIKVTRATISGTTSIDVSIDVSIAGDFSVLKAVFRAMRKAGYEPHRRPGKIKEASFSTYFNKDGQELRFWLNYSSTICTRKQVGTKMVETPIYEVVCE